MTLTIHKAVAMLMMTTSLWATKLHAQTWAPKKNIPSGNFDGAAIFSAGGDIYMGGGLYTNAIMEYDTLANTWVSKTSMPGMLITTRAGASGFTINDTGYIAFGYDQDPITMGEIDLTDLWQYNKAGNSWVRKQDFPPVHWYKRLGTMFVANGKAYFPGGYDSGTASKQLWQYDPVTNAWSQKHDLPVGIYGALTFTLGSKGYLSFCDLDSGATNFVFEYDAVADTWTRKNDMPAPRRIGPAAFVIDGHAFAGLGSFYDGAIHVFNDLYLYNQAADSWTAVDTTPLIGTYITETVSMGNKAFVGGGKNINTGAYSKEWYEVTSAMFSGIADVSMPHRISCYPNPTTDAITITGAPDCKSGCSCNIINTCGSVVGHKIWTGGKIETNNIPPGHYLLELSAGTEKYVTVFEMR